MLGHRDYRDGLVLLENSPKDLRRISSSSEIGESAQVVRSDERFECNWLESHSEVAFGIDQT